MKISENLSQQKFQEILVEIYNKGSQNTNIKVKELIEEIKQHLMKEIH
ncbi:MULTISPECIES: hypothetical protein [Bacillaceae]